MKNRRISIKRLKNLVKLCTVPLILFSWWGALYSQVISTNKLWGLYYGYPSQVNGSSTLAAAEAIWSKFKVVVFPADIVDGDGDGYADNTHPDFANTSNIIISLSNQTHFFGYIDLGVITKNWSTNQMKTLVDKWKDIGAYGIFWDDFGFDYSVTKARQDWAVNYTHSKGMKVIANAWDPDDVFWYGNSLEKGDGYCWENFLVVSNYKSYQHPGSINQSLNDWKTKSDKCLTYKYSSQFNGDLKIYCLSTLRANATSSEFSNTTATNLADYAFWGFTLYGFDYWQFTDYNYSAGNNYIYIYRHPVIMTQYAGDAYTTTNVDSTGVAQQYKRYTDQGLIYFNASNNIQPTNMGYFVKDTNGPNSVTGVNIYADSTGIHIIWNNPSSDFFQTVVYKSNGGFVLTPTNSNTGLIIYQGTGEEYLDTDIISGNTYYYTIYAMDKVHNYSVAYTNRIIYNDIWAPSPPSNFQINYDNSGNATLVWELNSEFDFKGYNIYRKDLNSSAFNKINSYIVTNNYYIDNNLSSGVYTYYVTSLDINGNESSPTEKLKIYVGDYNILKDKNVKIVNNMVNLNENTFFKSYFLLNNNSNVRIIVYDIYGKKIKDYTENYSKGINSINIDCSNMDSGVYIIKIISDEFNEKFKFAVVK